MTSSTPATPAHLVDMLDKASLLNLALDSPGLPGHRRAYVMPSKEELTPLFPDMEILDLISSGGMGCVYLAKQSRLERQIAVKILPKELAKDELFAERFAREARAMARLNHPNVVRVYDFGSSGDIFYLVMEYLDGMNLRELLEAGRLAPDEALRIFDQVSAALDYAHREGVIHRDIKPENILFSRAGHVSLADFGLARLAMDSGCELSLTQTRQAMGTLNYMAPEQWDNPRTVDHRADIYAMGILLYELLTGRVPRGSFPPASTLAKVPPSVDEVIHRALQVDPEKRFGSVREMRDALRSSVAGVVGVDIDHRGTFTRVLDFGGLIDRVLPVPFHGKSVEPAAHPKRARLDSTVAVSLFVFCATAVLTISPWCRVDNRYVPGIATSTLIEDVEVPNAAILVATGVIVAAAFFRKELHPVRANLISLVIAGLSLALIGTLVSGNGQLQPDLPFVAHGVPVRLTIAPFLILGLQIFILVETAVQIAIELLRPLHHYVIQPFRRYIETKGRVRNHWWKDRWSAARSLFRPSDDSQNRSAK